MYVNCFRVCLAEVNMSGARTERKADTLRPETREASLGANLDKSSSKLYFWVLVAVKRVGKIRVFGL